MCFGNEENKYVKFVEEKYEVTLHSRNDKWLCLLFSFHRYYPTWVWSITLVQGYLVYFFFFLSTI